MIVNNINTVITSFVSDPFIPDLTRYHLPIIAVFNFSKPKHTTFQRNIWKYDDGDYDKLRTILNSTNWDTILSNNNLESSACAISDVIISAAKESIPNKRVTARPNDIPWMKGNIYEN